MAKSKLVKANSVPFRSSGTWEKLLKNDKWKAIKSKRLLVTGQAAPATVEAIQPPVRSWWPAPMPVNPKIAMPAKLKVKIITKNFLMVPVYHYRLKNGNNLIHCAIIIYMKLRAALFFIALLALLPPAAAAQTTPPPVNTTIVIEVFKREDCGHCQDFFAFITDLQTKRDDFTVQAYDIYTDEGRKFFDEVTDKLKMTKATPIIYIGQSIIAGFDSPATTGQRIIALLDQTQGQPQPSLREILDDPEWQASLNPAPNQAGACDDTGCATRRISGPDTIVRIPFTDKTVNVSQYSLPALSFILGLIDGFNPCAMWVLVMFLAALVAINNRRKMLQVIGLFLLAETIMYYAILSAWLYAWDFIGLDRIVTPLVGLLAVGAGLYFLREYWRGDDTCKVTSHEQRARLSERIKNFASKPLTILSALGIIGVAFSVNIFEFACSIGIPQTFTKILDLNNLSWLGKQGYNFIYIIGYMIDDFVVFGLALYSFEKIGLTHKYTRASHLIGGILMLALGLIMLLRPGWLVA